MIFLNLAGGCRFLPKPGPRNHQARAEALLTSRNPFVTLFRPNFRSKIHKPVCFDILLCVAQ